MPSRITLSRRRQIVCGFAAIAAIQAFFAGQTLQTMYQKNRQDFEMELNRATAVQVRAFPAEGRAEPETAAPEGAIEEAAEA